MFIINLTYKVSIEIVEKHINDHIVYLKKQYALGNFQASGRKVPRDGGIILSTISDKNELLKILDQDPFKINDLADYELTEFIPSMTSTALDFLRE